MSFTAFYQQHFLAEHRHPVNIALHVAGTIAGTLYVPLVLVYWPLYWLLLYPVVHALPGLIGHRLFERNAVVGDVRVLRKDFSPLWFIAGNHVLTYQLCAKLFRPSKPARRDDA